MKLPALPGFPLLPKRRLFLVAVLATLVPETVYFVGILPQTRATMRGPSQVLWGSGPVLATLAWVWFFITAFMDPGWLPANAQHDEYLLHRDAIYGRALALRVREAPGESVLLLPYCEQCRLFRPPRSRHCWVCQRCCERVDHHCVWMGQCIGARNHRYFLLYLLTIWLLLVDGVAVCTLRIRHLWAPARERRVSLRAISLLWSDPAVLAVALGLYCFVIAILIGVLLVVQIRFACTDRTTAEACGRSAPRPPSWVGIRGLIDLCRRVPTVPPPLQLDSESRSVSRVWGYAFLGLEDWSNVRHYAIPDRLYRDRRRQLEALAHASVSQHVLCSDARNGVELSKESRVPLRSLLNHREWAVFRWRYMISALEPNAALEEPQDQSCLDLEQSLRNANPTFVPSQLPLITTETVTTIKAATNAWERTLSQVYGGLKMTESVRESPEQDMPHPGMNTKGAQVGVLSTETHRTWNACWRLGGRDLMNDPCVRIDASFGTS